MCAQCNECSVGKFFISAILKKKTFSDAVLFFMACARLSLDWCMNFQRPLFFIMLIELTAHEESLFYIVTDQSVYGPATTACVMGSTKDLQPCMGACYACVHLKRKAKQSVCIATEAQDFANLMTRTFVYYEFACE